jgi:hypothetical protein
MGNVHESWCESLNTISTETRPQPKFIKNQKLITVKNIEVRMLECKWDENRLEYVYYVQEAPWNCGWCLESELQPRKILLHD